MIAPETRSPAPRANAGNRAELITNHNGLVINTLPTKQEAPSFALALAVARLPDGGVIR